MDRRSFFEHMGHGLTGMALLSLLEGDAARAASQHPPENLLPRKPHYAPKAKSIIHLYMNGGPSQMDLFDPKEELDRNHGKSYFNKIAGEVENPTAAGALMKSPFKFARHGQSGAWVSEAMPHLATMVDDIALVKGLYTTNLTHEPAIYLMQSGHQLPGYPAIGAWVSYALGSENQSLPAYVVLDDPAGLPINGVDNWTNGFLSPVFQGTRFRATGAPVLNLKPEQERPTRIESLTRDLVTKLDRLHQRERTAYPQLEARLANYALAARMQLAATDALDLSQESPKTLAAYGVGKEPMDSYARRCVIARRLVERGVRFVQLYIERQIWDNHTELHSGMGGACKKTDQPVAALLRDLKQRGLLDEVLVVWNGEFGRLPIAQLTPDKDEKRSGRDHNKNAMVAWMAGAGVRRGISYGETDEIGLAAARDKVSVPDWHATIFHLLGLRHDGVVFHRNGLEERLTGVNPARVVKEILV